MKRRKLFTAVLTAALALGMAMNVSAADDGSVVFKGEAEKFVTHVDGEEFTGIRPGETKTMTLSLSNEYSEEMKFYMSAEILDNIAESGDKKAVYDFSIAKNGDTFFATVIGGEEKYNVSTGKEYLTEDNNILLDTLKKGQSDDVSITLALDGDSAKNSYQNQEGEIQLVFSVETPEAPPTVVEKVVKYVKGATNTVIKTVKTGDVLPIGIIIAAGVSLLAIIVVIVKRRKEKREEQ